MFKDQNTQLLQEFATLSQQLVESQDECEQLEHQVSRLLGHPSALESATIEECDELEKALKTSLDRVEAKKVGFSVMITTVLCVFIILSLILQLICEPACVFSW